MRINDEDISRNNRQEKDAHYENWGGLSRRLERRGLNPETLLDAVGAFQVAVPSWALGTGGTRFGRFPGGGEPATLEQKIEDCGLLRSLSRATSSISLHIPWDRPSDPGAIRQLAELNGLHFDAVNSNTFQDQKGQGLTYKFGSLCHTHRNVREQAIAHNLEVIAIGEALGSRAITVWLADGSNYPGQTDFRLSFERTLEGLKKIHGALPSGWRMFTEHKPFEPNFYSSVNADWGNSLILAEGAGENCFCLVDLGHHLPNANIEQIVSRLAMKGRLGGFHFNDSKYSDDDLTAGSLKPYQLFLIFSELVEIMRNGKADLAWMIDASHNTKDPLEDLLQSLEAIGLAHAQALLVDRTALKAAQESNDPVQAQEILQDAFRTDLRPLLAEARRQKGGALNPIQAFRRLEVRQSLIKERGLDTRSTGL